MTLPTVPHRKITNPVNLPAYAPTGIPAAGVGSTSSGGRLLHLWKVQQWTTAKAGAKTRSGLLVKAALDTNQYQTHLKVSDEELARLKLRCEHFHGEWNYLIIPRK